MRAEQVSGHSLELLDQLDEASGLVRVANLLPNDSGHPHASETAEHEHVGEGGTGEDGFERGQNANACRGLPMVLETPEGETGDAWNVQKLRELSDSV